MYMYNYLINTRKIICVSYFAILRFITFQDYLTGPPVDRPLFNFVSVKSNCTLVAIIDHRTDTVPSIYGITQLTSYVLVLPLIPYNYIHMYVDTP